MKRGRPRNFELTLSKEERGQLEQMSGSRTLPAGIVRRAQGILLLADGKSNQAIARELKVSTASVTYWQKRFGLGRLAGLQDLPKSGRPRTHDDDKIAGLLNKVLRQRPKHATHWSVRGVAAETGVSKSTVQRYFTLFGLQPHRSKSFKLSTDAFFVEKVRDIVGLYLNPPGKALVLCVDEKSQVQALERTQPMLPMGLGYVEGVTHDYYALLLFLYNTGARISEAVAIRCRDLQFAPPPHVRLLGKGRKERLCPLWPDTIAALKPLLARPAGTADPAEAVFRGVRSDALTRHGAAHRLAKYVAAAKRHDTTFPKRVSPHTLRHSCACALLQAGVDLTVIRDYLGHASIVTTSRYANSNLELKRTALSTFWEHAGLTAPKAPPWRPTKSLLTYLSSL